MFLISALGPVISFRLGWRTAYSLAVVVLTALVKIKIFNSREATNTIVRDKKANRVFSSDTVVNGSGGGGVGGERRCGGWGGGRKR